MLKILEEKLEQTQLYLNEFRIDAWIILTSRENDPCLPLITKANLVGTYAILITKKGRRVFLCNKQDAERLDVSDLFEVITTENLSETLKKEVCESKLATIALNISKEEHLADGLTAGNYRWLKRTLKGCFKGEYVSSESFLTKLRSIKSSSEIDRIQKAVIITEKIYNVIFSKLKAGMTEKEIGKLFVEEMKKQGVVNGIDRSLSMPIVLKENIAHRAPSDVVVLPGDLVIMDFSVDVDGYVSDIARTVYFLKQGEDKAPENVELAFQAVHEAISRAAKAIKPGVRGYEVDSAARNYYVSNGYPEITHATGHQIGRDVHDGGGLFAPKWNRYGKSPYVKIEEGMVFTIEPTLFLDDGIHFIVEENVVVTSTGITYLTKRQNELILIPYE